MKRNSQDSSPFPHGLFHRSKRYPWNHQSSESEMDLPPVYPVYASPEYFERDSQDSSPFPDDLSSRFEPYPWNHQSSDSEIDFPPMNDVYASPEYFDRDPQVSSPSPRGLFHRSKRYPWNHRDTDSEMDFPPMNIVYASPKFLERSSPDALLQIDALLRDGSLRRFDIPVHGSVSIGRDARCDLCVDDPLVSRRHLEIRANRGDVQIRDMDSTNGTRLNGEELRAPAALKSGDEVTIGNTRLVIRF